MRRIVVSLAMTALLVGTIALPATAVTPYTTATWKASIGTNATYGTAMLTAKSNGTGSLLLRARHLLPSVTYTVTIRKGTCSSPSSVLLTLPTTMTRTGTGGLISRGFSLTVTQMRPILKAPNKLAIWLVRGTERRCGVLAAQFPTGVVQINHVTLVPHTNDGAVGMHWITILGSEVWEPPSGWAELEEGETALAVHVKITAVELTTYGPEEFGVRTPGHVDLPPMIGRSPVLSSGSLAPGRSTDGWLTFVVYEDELGGLTLLYSPASGILLQFAPS